MEDRPRSSNGTRTGQVTGTKPKRKLTPEERALRRRRRRIRKIQRFCLQVVMVLLLVTILGGGLALVLKIAGNSSNKKSPISYSSEFVNGSGNKSGDTNNQEPNSEADTEPDTTIQQPDVTAVPEHKVVYLTFDDGPSKDTERLLDILDKYNVKVTFFVTNQNSKYVDLIGEEAKRGHTVGVHTYSHKFSEVYASTEAYVTDFNKMNDLIEKQTGSKAKLFRFPGGASNMESAKYCKGIMSSLTKLMPEKGYDYFDWNVLSGDSGDTTETSKVYENVIAGIQQHDVSVVLQHDIKDFSVDAVEDIIKWGLENGYTFLPLTTTSKACKHGVNN